MPPQFVGRWKFRYSTISDQPSESCRLGQHKTAQQHGYTPLPEIPVARGCRKRRYGTGKSYILSYAKIVGYGRPDFFIIKEEAEVTRGQFDQMMDDWLERRGGKVSAGWSPCVTADWLLGKK